MKRILRYSWRSWSILAVIGVLLTLCPSCNCGNRKEIVRRITLWRNDRNPYGTRVAYDGLSRIFPGADISVASTLQTFNSHTGKTAVICIAPYVQVSASEVNNPRPLPGGWTSGCCTS